ncbi:MAG: TetR/AcrR family transcriptional regulator [Sphingorhabdus sp.]
MSTRVTIMDVAAEAVRNNGYNGFSLDQIARDVGIRKSSIFHHFSSKSELVVAIFRRYSEEIFAFLDQTTKTEACAADRLMAYLLESRKLLEEGESICMSIALNIDQENLHAEIIEDLALFHDINIKWLTDTFELGLRDGSALPGGTPKEKANAFLAIVDGAQLIARSHRDVSKYDEATALLISRMTRAKP